jgi:hypothetical protein
MKLLVLILIVGLILLGFCLFRKNYEPFIDGKYVLEWTQPQNTGGDPKCCGYDWQICELEDKSCAKPVDSGSVKQGSALTASTTKVDWGNTYNVMVRANNMYGSGEWTTVQLIAGGGTLESVVFGQEIDKDGNVTIPVSASSTQVMVWAAISAKESKGAGNLAAEVNFHQLRDGKTVATVSGTMAGGTSSSGQDTFTGVFQNINANDKDVFKAAIYVVGKDGSVFTDGTGSITVSGSAPGAVGKITFKYVPLGATIGPSKQIDCEKDLNSIYAAMVGPQGSLQNASRLAYSLVQDPKSDYSLCNSGEKGAMLTYMYSAPPDDPDRQCAQAITLLDSVLTTPEEQCSAYYTYGAFPGSYRSPCFNNLTLKKWADACPK